MSGEDVNMSAELQEMRRGSDQYFRKVNIRIERKRSLSTDFGKRWVNVSSLARVNGASVDFLLKSPLKQRVGYL